MQKTLLRFLTFELVERVVRFNSILDIASADTPSPALWQSLKDRVSEIERQLMAAHPFLFRLFDEKSLKDRAFQTNLSRNLSENLYAPYRSLCELSRWLPQVSREGVRPETSMFLRDAVPDEVCKPYGSRAIVMTPEGDTPIQADELNNILIESLSVIQRDNPLEWAGLTRAYADALIANTPAFEALAKKPGNVSIEKPLFRELSRHLIALRILGPAYYFYSISKALIALDFIFLDRIEPALFIGLNYFNVADKNLVILHEAVEKSPETFGYTTPGGAPQDRRFQPDFVAELLGVVEKAVGDRLAFKARHFERAIQIQDKLDENTLISAHAIYPADQLRDQVLDAQNAATGAESNRIYDLLGNMRETPNSAREIINAGWFSKFDRSPALLFDAINERETGGFNRLAETLSARDHLLLKSIETAELHRMLAAAV